LACTADELSHLPGLWGTCQSIFAGFLRMLRKIIPLIKRIIFQIFGNDIIKSGYRTLFGMMGEIA
jgi:hypothetical protein